MKYWIFDWDGFLCNSVPSIFKFNMIKFGLSYDEAIEFTKNYASKPQHCNETYTTETFEEAHSWNIEFSEHIQDSPPPLFDELFDLLSTIEQYQFAIITNNSIRSILPSIQKTDIEFSPILALEDHHSKNERIKIIADSWNIPLESVTFFTDSNSDVLEVQRILKNQQIYCCSWGISSEKEAGYNLPSEQILTSFDDILNI